MKYILLGTLNTEWVAKHAERTKEARGKLRALGITLNAVYYTQGPYDFVDVIDAPSGEAALTFSVWYASQGYGRIQTLPAFDAGAMEQAARGEPKTRSDKTGLRPSGIVNPSMGDGGVTVFGGTGFLGRRIVARLAAAGTRVRVAVRHTTEGVPRQGGDIEVVYADVRDGGTVAQAIRGSDAVVNAVGLYVERGEATFQAVHVDGAREVVRAAREAGIGWLVHISGIGADVNSESPYVRSRALGERAVREACPEAIILRPSVLLGRGDALLRFLAAITRISPVFPLFGDGSTRLQPVFVGDVAEAIVKAVGSLSTKGKIYELGGPRVYHYRELVELVLVHLKRRRVLVPVPFFVWEIQAALLGVLPNPPLTRDQVILMRRDNVVSDTALTFADLGITPRSVEADLPSLMA